MRWSVTVSAAGDQVLSREQIVELADAVAPLGGVAAGIGTTSYGASLVVVADSREAAEEAGRDAFRAAARRAGLPDWPLGAATAISEAEDDDLGRYE